MRHRTMKLTHNLSSRFNVTFLKTSTVQFHIPVLYWFRTLIVCWVIHRPYFAFHVIQQSTAWIWTSYPCCIILSCPKTCTNFQIFGGPWSMTWIPLCHPYTLLFCSQHSPFRSVSIIGHLWRSYTGLILPLPPLVGRPMYASSNEA